MKTRVLATVCIVIALVSLALSAYAAYMMDARVTALEKEKGVIIYNGVVILKADGTNPLEVDAENFHLSMNVVWQDAVSKAIQLNIEMRQGDPASSTQQGTGDLYYLVPNDVKIVTFRGYTVQVWFITANEMPSAAVLKVVVVNIGSPQPPVDQRTGIVFSGDVTFGKGLREDFSAATADFNFSLRVNVVDHDRAVLTYSMQQGGVTKNETVAEVYKNDVVVEDFRGYTMKLWVKEIIPSSLDNTSATVIINIRITQ